MHRPIKFRAWDPLTKQMIGEGYHVIGEYTMFQIIEQWVHEHPDGKRSPLERMGDIVEMQFTGLLDKKRKEIYEADIIKCAIGLGVVVWWKWGWFIEVNGGHFTFDTAKHQQEVIGNVFEHPELLKQ